MQQLTQELEQDETRSFRHQVGSPLTNSPPGRSLTNDRCACFHQVLDWHLLGIHAAEAKQLLCYRDRYLGTPRKPH